MVGKWMRLRWGRPDKGHRNQQGGSERAHDSVAEDRPPDTPGEQVVEEEMELKDATDAVAAQAVDRNDHFGADLVVLPGPDDAGLDGAGGEAALVAIEGRRHGYLDPRDHASKRLPQPGIHYVWLGKFG